VVNLPAGVRTRPQQKAPQPRGFFFSLGVLAGLPAQALVAEDLQQHQEADAVALRRAAIRAHERAAPLAFVRAGRPGFLAIQHPALLIQLRAGGEGCKV